MRDTFLRRWRVLARSGPASLEAYMALMSLVWAFVLNLPTMRHTRVVAVLGGVMPLWIWSLAMVALCIVQFGVLGYGSPLARKILAYASVFFWACVSGLFCFFALLNEHMTLFQALTSNLQFVMLVVGQGVIVISLTVVWRHSRG